MTDPRRLAWLLSLCALVWSAPAGAQDFDGSIGYGAGMIWFTDFNAGAGGATSLALDPGWVAAGHAEHWAGRGRLGTRVNVAFSSRPLQTLDDVRDIHTWIIGGDFLLRLLAPHPDNGFVPFIAVGGGVASYGLGSGDEVLLPAEGARYPGNTDRRATASIGAGFDILPRMRILGTPTGLRIEVIDHIAVRSPFAPIAGGSFDPVHNLRVSIGVLGLVDILR